MELPQLRREKSTDIVDNIAYNLGFYLKELTESSNQISIAVLLKPKGIDQDSELYMGYQNHTRLYKVKMWYEEK